LFIYLFILILITCITYFRFVYLFIFIQITCIIYFCFVYFFIFIQITCIIYFRFVYFFIFIQITCIIYFRFVYLFIFKEIAFIIFFVNVVSNHIAKGFIFNKKILKNDGSFLYFAHAIMITQTILISNMPVQIRESERSCISVIGITVLPLSTIFRLDFGTVPTFGFFNTFFHAIVKKIYVCMLLFISIF
jgi:hypothetical protein